MKGWPKPNEVTRQADLAAKALHLSEATGYSMADVLTTVKNLVALRGVATAEVALTYVYLAYELPNPYDEGQQHLVINEGALVAPEGGQDG